MVVNNTKGIALIFDKRREKIEMSKNRLALESKLSRPTVLNAIREKGFRKGYDINSFLNIAEALGLEVIIRPI